MAKSDSDRGNRPQDYKSKAADHATERELVAMLRGRIDRASAILRIDERVKEAEKGDEFLNGTATGGSRRIYIRYLLPLLEEAARDTIPAIPSAQIEAKTEVGEGYADKARELIDDCFSAIRSKVRQTTMELRWDDFRAGVGFGKTVLRNGTVESRPQTVRNEEELQANIARAQAENLRPELATLGPDDNHEIHLKAHDLALGGMDIISPEWADMWEHRNGHRTALIETVLEYPVFERVPWYRFVYDPDVPWDERTWECERRSEKIADLIDLGYKNINRENLPPEDRGPESALLPYEDMTAAIYEFRDRRTGEKFVLSAEGPINGLLLFRGAWTWGKQDIYVRVVYRPVSAEQSWGTATIGGAVPILKAIAEIDFQNDRHVREHGNYKRYLPPNVSDDVKKGLNDPNQHNITVPAEMWAAGGPKDSVPPPLPVANIQQREALLNELRHWVGIDPQQTGKEYQHQITATESNYRGEAQYGRKVDAQEIAAAMLSEVANNFIALYRDYATQKIRVRLISEAGPEYSELSPDELPGDIRAFLDIKAEAEASRTRDIQSWQLFIQFRQALGELSPTKWDRISEDFGRKLGIPHPEKYRAPAQAMTQPQPGEIAGAPGMTETAGAAEAGPTMQTYQPGAQGA